jgi:hypothetical protein
MARFNHGGKQRQAKKPGMKRGKKHSKKHGKKKGEQYTGGDAGPP